jgi:four helix bundle protein
VSLNKNVMAKIEKFEDLKVWQEAVKIGVEVYNLTSKGVLARDYSTKDQIRRAAVSISNNIAEGFEYNNNGSFIRFLKYSKGSAGELRSNLLILKEAEIIRNEEYERLKMELLKVSKSIEALIKYLKEFELKKRNVK